MNVPLLILYAATVLLVGPAGNAICSVCLSFFVGGSNALRAPDAAEPSEAVQRQEERLGRAIGTCERSVVLLALLVGSWELIAGVIALKTVARFNELDKKIPAEYFLIGSLLSLFVGTATSLMFIFLEQKLGGHVVRELRALVPVHK